MNTGAYGAHYNRPDPTAIYVQRFQASYPCTEVTGLIWLLSLAVPVAGLLTGPELGASALSHPSHREEGIQVDRDYLLALNTADEFLHAWLKRDWLQGPKYLTANLRERAGEQGVKSFFSGVSNPHHQGYEIVSAERVSPNLMRFHVWLYEYYTDSSPPPEQRPPTLDLYLEKVSEWSWKVKDFPKKQ